MTGSGKTFTVAKVIEAINRPTLVLSHNKTLAAQLYQEFRSFFPENAVEYFVSYYDYYQPEAYIPQSDTYIEKETSRNEEIDKLRLSASKALFERRDVLVVASVSCIYGLGAPDAYYDMLAYLEVGRPVRHAARCSPSSSRCSTSARTSTSPAGSFRVRGDVLEIHPAYEDIAVRVEFFGDEIEKITRIDPLRGTPISRVDRLALYPRTFYATPRETLDRAVETIKAELEERLGGAERRGEAPRSAAAPPAHDVRPRDDQGARLLQRDRELLAAPVGPAPGRAAPDAPRLLPARLPARRGRVARDAAAGARACTTATARARRSSSSTASGSRRRSTTGR